MNFQIMTSHALHGMKRDGRSEYQQEKTAQKLSVAVGCCEMPGFTGLPEPGPDQPTPLARVRRLRHRTVGRSLRRLCRPYPLEPTD
jgi:hypothetical protein